ncbi:hypothetical protein SAY87_001188 [Trapa incisa]|uniref:Uncharacterized protein n=1 Tax=Trapa incisa TaxID=236973 RepID=A0AAN7GUX3_9MYRT|nr:hypothetical protein SAY87_001188 [Trapa incisa]
MEDQEVQQSNSCQVSPQATTPELKLQAEKPAYVGVNLSFSSSDESFESSPDGGTESSSLSPDSESEYFASAINGYLDTARQTSDHGQLHKDRKTAIEPISMNLSSDEVGPNEFAKGGEHGNHEELVQYEGELEVLKLKLHKSEGEVGMLKDALNRSDIAAHDLKVQLETMKIEMEKKDAKIDEATCKILHLESRTHELESHIAHFHCKTEMLINELSQAEENLGRSKEDAAALSTELDLERQKAVELQERIFVYQRDVSDRENEILMLVSENSEVEEKHSVEKEQLIMQWESQYKQLEVNLLQREDEMRELHHALVLDMQDRINNSKIAVEERETQIDGLNKEIDMLKLRHGTIVAEGDGLSAQIQALFSELSCRDNHIKELTAETASMQEVASMLRSRVQALEKEVEMQKILISDGAEKKREAIRQLCFSLEHYRTGYHELREAFRGRSKRHAVFVL